MQRLAIGLAFVAVVAYCEHSPAQQRRQDRAWDAARVEVYKTIGEVGLKLYIAEPQGHQAGDRRPAIVFFFGGGWRSGSPAQFAPHCKYLASRGMLAMAADYRVSSRHGTKVDSCVRDAKSAVRWIRAHAAELGIDPDRIAAAGGSAGGHLAACTALIEGFDESGEDTSISSVPSALVLFNPALVLAPVQSLNVDDQRIAGLADRIGVEPQLLSPVHHVRRDLPPTIIFHGKADTTVPYPTAVLFCEKMNAAGNDCTLVGYDGQTHGFFNYGRSEGAMYRATLKMTDQFLIRLGYLSGRPTIGE